MKHFESQGFSLTESLVALSLVSILLSMAVPAMGKMFSASETFETGTKIVTTMMRARDEAERQGVRVSVCARAESDPGQCADQATSDWNHGWLVFIDRQGASGHLDGNDEIIYAVDGIAAQTRLTGSAASVSFDARGMLDSTALRLELRGSECSMTTDRNIDVDRAGQAIMEMVSCDVT